VSLLDGLPTHVPALSRIVRGLVIHPVTAHLYGVRVPDERLCEQDTRGIAAILARIRELDASPLTVPRPPERRFVGCCRDFSTLLCAMLRHHGVPAGTRTGCARYFVSGFNVEHWVCAYWQPGVSGGRWMMVDAELDEAHCAVYGIAFDPHDVPRDELVLAGEAWRRCRAGEASPDSFGVTADSPPNSPVRGWPYLQSQVVRDFACLNNVELLCWDLWGLANARELTSDVTELALLDRVATLTLEPDSRFADVRRLYRDDPRLRVPPTITTLVWAGHGRRTPAEVAL